MSTFTDGVPTQGEVMHADLDFVRLTKERDNAPWLEARANVSAGYTPGAATLGALVAPLSSIVRRRALNSDILNHETDTPGGKHMIGYQPQSHYKSLEECWMANSTVLTPKHVVSCRDKGVHGGADAYTVFVNRHTSAGGTTEMHVVLIIFPHDKRDGKPVFLEVIYNMAQISSANQNVVKKVFGSVHTSNASYRNPESIFERMFAQSPQDPNLGLQDLVWSQPVFPRGKMLADIHPQVYGFRKDNQQSWATQGILEFTLDKSWFQQVNAKFSLIKVSHDMGEPVTNGSHVRDSSCGHTILRTLFDVEGAAGVNWNQPLPDVLFALARKASACYSSNEKNLSFYNFMNDKTSFDKGDATTFIAQISAKLNEPTLKSGLRGATPFNSQYCMDETKRHPDHTTATWYDLAFEDSGELLKLHRRDLKKGKSALSKLTL